MKAFKFSFLIFLTACSVTKNEVVNRPPVVPVLSGKLMNLFGTLDPLTSLSVFFWPETRGGQPLTMEERQDMVAQVNIRGAKLDYLTDQQEVAQQNVCRLKAQFVREGCMQFDLDPREEESCSTPWTTSWKGEADIDAALIPQLTECKSVVVRGQEAEQVPDQLAAQKMVLQQELIQILETESSSSQFMFTDAANSKVEMTPGENGEIQFRIKLAFTSPNLIYDSVEDPERGLIDQISYDERLHVLRFQMHEKKDGEVTGGIFDVTAARVLNSPQIVRFSGEMTYTSPDGLKRAGRIKFDGYFAE